MWQFLYSVFIMMAYTSYGMYVDTKGQSNCILVKKHAKIMQELLHNKSIYQNFMNAAYPLHYACRHNLYEVVNFLLKNGAFCNEQGVDKMSPLHEACAAGHDQIIKLLVIWGACDSATYTQKEYCLHKAVQSGNVSSILLLLDAGFCVHNRDFLGNTSLDILFALSGTVYNKTSLMQNMELLQEYGSYSAKSDFEICGDIIKKVPENFYEYQEKLRIVKRCIALEKVDTFPSAFSLSLYDIVTLIASARFNKSEIQELIVHAFFVKKLVWLHDFLFRYDMVFHEIKKVFFQKCITEDQKQRISHILFICDVQRHMLMNVSYKDCSLITYL